MSRIAHMFSRRCTRTSILGGCAALISLNVIATAAHAQTAINRGWPLHADGAVKIFNDVGSIRVIGWDRDSVMITGTAASTGKLFAGGSPDGVKMGMETASGLAKPSDFVIHVPSRARIWVRSASASIDISEFSGTLDASTVSGAVRIQGSPSELRAESMNGVLDISASPSYLRLKSATGGITWTGSSDDVGIITVSGRVVVNGGTVRRARFESIGGEIRFGGTIASTGSMAIDTHSGNVTLAFTKGATADLEVSARGCDFFGAKQGLPPGNIMGGEPKTFYKTVGKPSLGGQSIVIRSYKGYVTAVMQ